MKDYLSDVGVGWFPKSIILGPDAVCDIPSAEELHVRFPAFTSEQVQAFLKLAECEVADVAHAIRVSALTDFYNEIERLVDSSQSM